MSNDEIVQAAFKEVLSNNGSGASVGDPRRLGQIHPLLAPSIEHALVSGIYGDKGKDWFDAGRRYHKNDSVCEQLIRVGRNPKPDWAKPDHVYSMFFEISQLTDSAPVPDDFRKTAAEATLKMPVPDASFVSRFPLTAIKAHDAKEAARTIAGYLAQAQAAGWKVGSARALVEEWRNEYDLTKGDEKTTFRFDMRPMLTSPSRLELVALTLIAGTAKLEEIINNFESMGSWPEAFARADLSFVDTSEKKTQSGAASAGKQQRVSTKIYLARDGKSLGPFTEEKLREMRSMGQVTGDDLVWRDGFAEWKPLSTILGEAQPPPLPKEVGAPPDLSVPDFVIDADRNIHLNKDSLQKYFDEKVQLVGRDRSVEIGKFQLGAVLVSAAATDWTGGVDLFDTGMAGRRRLTLKTLDQKVISERDAILLSLALNKMITTVTETVGPLPSDESPIAEWKLVAGIAGGGKFSIQFIG